MWGGGSLVSKLDEISSDITDIGNHTSNTNNPHSVTKSQVGLGNVENKSSATIRGELTKANVTSALGYTPPTSDTNTWRGIQNNLTSTSTTDSLSAAQGKILNDKILDIKNHTYSKYIKTSHSVPNGDAIISQVLEQGTYLIIIYHRCNTDVVGGWFGYDGYGVADTTDPLYGAVTSNTTIMKVLTVTRSAGQEVGIWNFNGKSISNFIGTCLFAMKLL